MIIVCNVKIQMKCVRTFRTGRHKCQADITLLFQYILQVNMFLSKLTGTQVGFTTLGLLTITKEFLLTVCVYINFFALRFGI